MSRSILVISFLGFASACVANSGPGEGDDLGETGEVWGEAGERPEDLEFVRELELLRVTANQGVEVEIGRDGAPVGPEARTGFLISDRPMLVRAYWGELPDSWEPRNLTGRLSLAYEDGSTAWGESTVYVGEAASPISLGRTFSWHLPADRVRFGMRYRVEMFEAIAANAGGEDPDPPPAIPVEGDTWVGTQAEPLSIKVVIVPVRHAWEECDQTPELTQTDLDELASALMQANPAQVVEMSLREQPFTWEMGIGAYDDYSWLLDELSQLRQDDAPAHNVYYYAPVAPCDGPPGGISGQAFGIPGPNKTNAYQRVAVGLWPGSGAQSGPLFVHEMGHLQGRYHVACSGGEEGPDPAYPHPDGRIGVWGYGIEDDQLHSPETAHDYMTYCPDRWVSDYGWNHAFDVIATLTSWDFEGRDLDDVGTLLVGSIDARGRARWWTTPGGIEPGQLAFGDYVELSRGSGASVVLPAAVQRRPHSQTRVIAVALPELSSAPTRAEYVSSLGRVSIPLASFRPAAKRP